MERSREQEIELQRKESDIYREPEIEGQGEGHRDTKSRRRPGKETETCLK